MTPLKATRSRPSPGLRFNHSTLIQKLRCQDSLKYWYRLSRDPLNCHLHRRAEFKIRWLNRKLRILERLV